MARQGKGIIDGFKGNVGNIQGSNTSKLKTIRKKPVNPVKIITPAYTKTVTNFEIALNFYDLAFNSIIKPLFQKTYKNTTAKQHFISQILSLLNPEGTQKKHLKMFPNSLPYDKIKTSITPRPAGPRWSFYYNYKPLPLLSNSTDKRIILFFNEYTSESRVYITVTRGTTVSEIQWGREQAAGYRRFEVLFFVSEDLSKSFIGYAMYNII